MPAKKIFIYEYISGGGLLHDAAEQPPALSLLAEGKLMLSAVAADFARIDECEVRAMHDDRFNRPATDHGRITWHAIRSAEEELETFCLLASQADWTLVIAPEFDGILVDRCRRVLSSGGRLLNPPLEFTELAADKHLTCEHLHACGVKVPVGVALDPQNYADQIAEQRGNYTAILKPRFGAGSRSIFLIGLDDPPAAISEPCRLEQFLLGRWCSVAFLCSDKQQLPLVPCWQQIASDTVYEYDENDMWIPSSPPTEFPYVGGSTPIAAEFAERAARLAAQAAACLPNPRGYFGIDMVLDKTAEGDRVVEINPRLTTSYIGLRQAYRGNLAAAMLMLAEDATVDTSELQLRALKTRAVLWRL